MAVSKVIGKQVGGSFPGTISRSGDQLVQVRLATNEIGFGEAVVVDVTDTSKWAKFTNGPRFAGFAVRKVGQPNVYVGQDEYNKYLENEDCDVLTRGFITVQMKDTTNIAINNTLYIVTQAGSGFEVGDLVTEETVLDTAVSTELDYILITSEPDDNNIVEIHILTTNV